MRGNLIRCRSMFYWACVWVCVVNPIEWKWEAWVSYCKYKLILTTEKHKRTLEMTDGRRLKAAPGQQWQTPSGAVCSPSCGGSGTVPQVSPQVERSRRSPCPPTALWSARCLGSPRPRPGHSLWTGDTDIKEKPNPSCYDLVPAYCRVSKKCVLAFIYEGAVNGGVARMFDYLVTKIGQ